jgi:hypothetical protein
MVLEVQGKKGVLRIDISENEIKRIGKKGTNSQDNSSSKEVN